MKKIGIMGGTFNPIHNAHIRMAQAACEQYHLDEVWFMPSKNPPHKGEEDILPEEHRSRMIQLAMAGIPCFHFSDLELRRDGITYTCDTLKVCREQEPKAKFYFILGGDSLSNFEKWRHPEKIAAQCTVLAVARYGVSRKEVERLCNIFSKKYNGKFRPVQMPSFDISSQQIRHSLSEGNGVAGWLPEKVLDYIYLHELYGAGRTKNKMKEKDILRSLQVTLRPKRYRHTLGVAMTAANLAACHMTGEKDRKRARIAGLLHDCAKYVSEEELLSLCHEKRIPLSETEEKNPALIHGKLGAYWAVERYGIDDEEICSAISYHTTGKPNMTTLEKILYVADYMEPYREMACSPYALSEIRKQCFHDLDKGLLMILTNTVNYLKDSEMPIDEMTLQTYEYYQKEEEHDK